MNQNGKYIFGMVKVGEKGQIVIPKKARDLFQIKAGDLMLILGDEMKGSLVMLKSDALIDFANSARTLLDYAENPKILEEE